MRIDATHVNGVRRFRKRTVEQIEKLSIEEVRWLSTPELRMIEVLCPTEQFVKLDCTCGPTRNVLRQLLQQRQSSFATPIANHVCYFTFATSRRGIRILLRVCDCAARGSPGSPASCTG